MFDGNSTNWSMENLQPLCEDLKLTVWTEFHLLGFVLALDCLLQGLQIYAPSFQTSNKVTDKITKAPIEEQIEMGKKLCKYKVVDNI